MSSHALAAGVGHQAERSLAHGFSWMLAGRVGVMLGQWGILVLLARLANVETLGLYGLGLALCAPVFAAFDARLPSVLATGGTDDVPAAIYLRLRLVTGALAFACCAAMAVAGYGRAAVVTGTVVLIALAKAAESVSSLLHGLLQKHDRMNAVGQSLLLGNLLAVVLAAVGLWATRSLAAALVGVAIGRLVTLAAFDLPRAAELPERLGDRTTRRTLLALAWTVAPLSVVMVLKSLSSTLPRLVLESSIGRAELGYFTALASFLIAATAVSTALCQAAGPRLARALRAGASDFRRQVGMLLAGSALLGLIGVAVGALLGAPLLRLVYGAEYAAHGAALAWMLLAATALHLRAILGTALTAMRSLRSQTLISGVTLAVAAAASLLAIPAYGLDGAVAATVITSVVSALTAAVVMVAALRRTGGAA